MFYVSVIKLILWLAFSILLVFHTLLILQGLVQVSPIPRGLLLEGFTSSVLSPTIQ